MKFLLPHIRLGREIIAQTEKKILGKTLDVNLYFETHIVEVCNILSRSIAILYELK